MLGLFKFTDKKIYKQLGNVAYITNGVGYGFISDAELYNNGHIEIGIGRTTSGYGDWGGGFDKATTSPLKIVIDKDYNIIRTETDSFYNSMESKRVELIAKKIQKRLDKKFIVEQELMRECIDKIFSVIPIKRHIGLDINLDDVSHTRNMLKYFTEEQKGEYDFADAKCINKKV